jgi:hypothetical protein
MQRLLAEVTARHYPHAPASPAQIEAFEARVGWQLDADLREFYLHCDGATLFRPRPHQTFWILSLADIRRSRVAMRFQDDDTMGSPAWWTLVDLGDDDYSILDVSRQEDGRYPILDAYHESYPKQVVQIAPSFRTWLDRTLRSGNQLWWLPG